jgi:hypothetical protein
MTASGDRPVDRDSRPDAARMAELRARVAASRAEQGLPPFITDEATLDRICDLLVVMQRRDGAPTRPTERAKPQADPDVPGDES